MRPARSISAQGFARATNTPLAQVHRLIRRGQLLAWRDRVTWTWRIPLPLPVTGARAATSGNSNDFKPAREGKNFRPIER